MSLNYYCVYGLYKNLLFIFAAAVKERRLRTDSDTSGEVDERPASLPSVERHRDDRDERAERPEQKDYRYERSERIERPERVDKTERLDKLERPERVDSRGHDEFYDRTDRDG